MRDRLHVPEGPQAREPQPGLVVRAQDGAEGDIRGLRRAREEGARRVELREGEPAETHAPALELQLQGGRARQGDDARGLREDAEPHRRVGQDEDAERADVGHHRDRRAPRHRGEEAPRGPRGRQLGRAGLPRGGRGEGHAAHEGPQAGPRRRARADRGQRGPRGLRRLRQPPRLRAERPVPRAEHVQVPRRPHGPRALRPLVRARDPVPRALRGRRGAARVQRRRVGVHHAAGGGGHSHVVPALPGRQWCQQAREGGVGPLDARGGRRGG
mmetsp:Transcript_81357/g.230544  ORF Transcript_81357/g.230544 Transcript_81357/m.230544 type:complete len:271 (-) Transcript_81357:314-1126(-)